MITSEDELIEQLVSPSGKETAHGLTRTEVVFSNSLTSAGWGETTIAAGNLAEAITRLKQECSDGYLLARGGARFARSLVEAGLIDDTRDVLDFLIASHLLAKPRTTARHVASAMENLIGAPQAGDRRPPRLGRVERDRTGGAAREVARGGRGDRIGGCLAGCGGVQRGEDAGKAG
ncbi:hypothetical protein [Actinomadura macra]|uniref:hypothetical protein n=1 Tax=Actinomadura macra TaxID=46164 RepID=UPI00083258BD|nr:hypothetical protein [Actinomadura macra]